MTQTPRVERSQKRVRVYAKGELVADSTAPLLVWEIPYYPTYYLPVEDVKAKLIAVEDAPGDRFDVVTGAGTVPGAALRYPDSPVEELRGVVRLEWAAMDHWFEEDEPIYTHPRDPYHRVDILASSRRVRVDVDGVRVAESGSPRILFETGLPPRYYLPLPDVRMDLLVGSDTRTHCPYKGEAGYFSLRVKERTYDDLVWIYRTPLPESQKIAGLACFYHEKVDLYIDGVRRDRVAQ